MKNYFSLSMQPREINQISALGLAHCGDAVFELSLIHISEPTRP